jgi:hypothetical protein
MHVSREGGEKFLLTSSFIGRLERRQTTASYSVRTSGLVPATDRASDRCASRNRKRVPESGRHCRTGTWCLGRVPANPANEVTTGSQPELGGLNRNINPENLPHKRKNNPEDSKPANEVTTGFGVGLSGAKSENPKPTPSACEPFRELIELGLSRDRNAMAIWQDLVAEAGFRGGYGTVKRFVRKLRGNRPVEARAVIVTAPGEEAQVDYGTGPMVRDPQSGKYRRTRLFVMTLGYSRKAVRLLTFRSSSRIWAELHEKAFRRLGGSTRIVVLDN